MAVNFFLAPWLLLWVWVSYHQVGSQLISKNVFSDLPTHYLFFLVNWPPGRLTWPENKEQFLVKVPDTGIYLLPTETETILLQLFQSLQRKFRSSCIRGLTLPNFQLTSRIPHELPYLELSINKELKKSFMVWNLKVAVHKSNPARTYALCVQHDNW